MNDSSGLTRIHVDISLFAERDAFGRISGCVEVAVVPQIGDTVGLDLLAAPVGPEAITGSSLVRVESRRIPVNGEGEIAVNLSDFSVRTRDDALRVMAFLQDRYDLFGEPFRDEDLQAMKQIEEERG